MRLINLLIRELNNCSSGGDFRVSHHAEMFQFDRLSPEINFKRARSCNYVIPRLVQVKMKILYLVSKVIQSMAQLIILTVADGVWRIDESLVQVRCIVVSRIFSPKVIIPLVPRVSQHGSLCPPALKSF